MSRWPVVTLGEVTRSVDYGFTSAAVWDPAGPQMLRITDIQNGSVDWSQVPRCDPGKQGFDEKLLSQGDIVFARTGATTGKSFLIRDCPANAVFASYLIRVRPGPRLDPMYLAHFFNSPGYWSQIRLRARGAAQPGINATKLKQLEVPLPPLGEQGRIATILDRAVDIGRKREQALILTDDLLRAGFLDLFGDPAFNPRRFQVKVVDSVLTKARPGTQSGPFGSALKKYEYVDQGVPVWGIDNVRPNNFVPKGSLFITEEKYRDLERYAVREGDVLISRAGTVGRMCIARWPGERSIIGTNLVRVSLDRDQITPEYFVSLFTHFSHRLGGLKTNQKENAFTFLNPKTLRALEIPVPPHELQGRFSTFCESLSKFCNSQKTQLAQASDLFGALSQRAFIGEL